ncbi:MAG: rRNA maturation RNase YbeY [Bacteroidales bacterium]|jgi:rRNA maturation RNase YbeY|nr:rRNA maturation RNase YbeY [Bacteroidales bacterium]
MITLSTNTDFKLPFQRTALKDWIKKIAVLYGKEIGEISYIFCDDEYLLEINQEYLNHDTYTDIVTFDYSEDDIISGDIFISVDRVKENAKKLKIPFERELKRVIIHGILHLCGLKDKTSEESSKMREEEEKALSLQ